MGSTLPVVTASGALIKHSPGHTTLFRAEFDQRVLAEMLTFFAEQGHEPVLYTDSYGRGYDFHLGHPAPRTPELREFLGRNSDAIRIDERMHVDPPEGVFAGFVIGTRDAMSALAAELDRRWPDALYVHVIRSPRYLGFMCDRAGRRQQVVGRTTRGRSAGSRRSRDLRGRRRRERPADDRRRRAWAWRWGTGAGRRPGRGRSRHRPPGRRRPGPRSGVDFGCELKRRLASAAIDSQLKRSHRVTGRFGASQSLRSPGSGGTLPITRKYDISEVPACVSPEILAGRISGEGS
ncbi:MAG: hypothetical protein QM811_09230 [Pirellulales bacterium]